jgi:hypothetical protein
MLLESSEKVSLGGVQSVRFGAEQSSLLSIELHCFAKQPRFEDRGYGDGRLTACPYGATGAIADGSERLGSPPLV